jgi:AraC-like DNA-binding protein
MKSRKQRVKADLQTLTSLLGDFAPYDGTFDLRIPSVHAIRVTHPHKELTHYTQPSCVCLVVQGAKSAMVGDETYDYSAGKIAVFSVDVPMAGRVTRASAGEPYFNFKIDLDAARIAELALRVFPNGVPQTSQKGAVYIIDADDAMIDAAVRFLELMRRPADAELLAPLVLDEILIRLLRSPAGSRIAQIGRADSSFDRIAKAVTWLRQHYDETADIEHLAGLVNMSVTSFHRQFKALTAMSPLQYQKALRLQEARRLMLTSAVDAGAAGRRVGYMSASHFTREYGRFFGSAPLRDINRLRAEGISRDEAIN